MFKEHWLYYRRLLKVSVKEVSKGTGISIATITRYENGHSDITGEKIEKLFTFLGINIIFVIDIKKQDNGD